FFVVLLLGTAHTSPKRKAGLGQTQSGHGAQQRSIWIERPTFLLSVARLVSTTRAKRRSKSAIHGTLVSPPGYSRCRGTEPDAASHPLVPTSSMRDRCQPPQL